MSGGTTRIFQHLEGVAMKLQFAPKVSVRYRRSGSEQSNNPHNLGELPVRQNPVQVLLEAGQDRLRDNHVGQSTK